jgi:exopolysaccharide/PEP-CTERM locus tyrosine autokinase
VSLIERAAQRLEELRRAGVEIPARDGATRPADTSEAMAPRRPAPMALNEAPAQKPALAAISRKFELDLVRLGTAGFVTPDSPRSRIAEEFRILKRPLLLNAAERRQGPLRHGNLIMVTSAVPGEGKTFTSLNLAMSIASELNRTVLLVDADVARPSMPHVLGVPTGPGLMDVLENPSLPLADVMIRTNVDKLSLLTSGSPHAQATELLASDAMGALLDDLSTRYPDRIVIFDSPPLLVTTESRVLATHMGQIVIVVRAESTLQSDVKKAIATVEKCPVKSLVLNRAKTAAQGAYGYGYGYGYGS